MGQLPQRAGLPGLNGRWTAVVVPPNYALQINYLYHVDLCFTIYSMHD